jgi:hypothetical protein
LPLIQSPGDAALVTPSACARGIGR